VEFYVGKLGLRIHTDVKNGDYLPWFAQRQALMTGANLVVYGHTHIPVRGLKDGAID